MACGAPLDGGLVDNANITLMTTTTQTATGAGLVDCRFRQMTGGSRSARTVAVGAQTGPGKGSKQRMTGRAPGGSGNARAATVLVGEHEQMTAATVARLTGRVGLGETGVIGALTVAVGA